MGGMDVRAGLADVANAEVRTVLAPFDAVRAFLPHFAAGVNRACRANHVVVADFGKALGLVPAVDVVRVEVAARGGSAAMDDDFVDV